jgi:hypothetical protein
VFVTLYAPFAAYAPLSVPSFLRFVFLDGMRLSWPVEHARMDCRFGSGVHTLSFVTFDSAPCGFTCFLSRIGALMLSALMLSALMLNLCLGVFPRDPALRWLRVSGASSTEAVRLWRLTVPLHSSALR